MLEGYSDVLDSIEAENKRTMFGQTNLFAMESLSTLQSNTLILPPKQEFPSDVILRFEKETVGMFISGHPIAPYQSLIKQNKFVTTEELGDNFNNYYDGQKVSILGVITQIKIKNTKSNKSMARIILEDMHGEIEVLVFPNVLARYESSLYEYKVDNQKSIVVLNGSLDLKDEGSAKLICDSVSFPSDYKNNTDLKEKKLYIKVVSEDSYEYKSILGLLKAGDRGDYRVYVRFSDTNTLIKLNKNYSTDCNSGLISSIKDLIGDSCVAIRG